MKFKGVIICLVLMQRKFFFLRKLLGISFLYRIYIAVFSVSFSFHDTAVYIMMSYKLFSLLGFTEIISLNVIHVQF